jgi:hypothetical protein
MLRKTRSVFFFPGNAAGGGNFAGLQQMMQQNPNQKNQNPLAQMMMNKNDNAGGAGAAFDPAALAQMRQQFQSQMTPEMREQMRNQMLQNFGGKNGGTISFGMMGVGVNEKGKKVARAAKLDFDMSTGKMEKNFHEKQLDPDDPMLPKETVENYDTEDCIEVKLDDNNDHQQQTSKTVSSNNIDEVEVLEVVIEEEETKTNKK